MMETGRQLPLPERELRELAASLALEAILYNLKRNENSIYAALQRAYQMGAESTAASVIYCVRSGESVIDSHTPAEALKALAAKLGAAGDLGAALTCDVCEQPISELEADFDHALWVLRAVHKGTPGTEADIERLLVRYGLLEGTAPPQPDAGCGESAG